MISVRPIAASDPGQHGGPRYGRGPTCSRRRRRQYPGRGPMDPVVSLRAAVALLGRFPALAGVDLDVGRGEVVLLRGPNGAGKTTLLRACAGLLPVVDGRGGRARPRPPAPRPARGAPPGRAARPRHRPLRRPHRRRQRPLLGPGRRRRRRRRRRPPWPASASTAASPTSPVGRLSAGQRRRTSLACLVARRPELWLLDEPHAGLDQAGRDVLDGLIAGAAAAGATVARRQPRARAGRRASPTASSTVAGGDRSASTRRRAVGEVAGARVTPLLVAGKDLRVELRSRVTTNQVAPFALLVLVLFAFALDPDRPRARPGHARAVLAGRAVLRRCSPSQRAFAVEAADGNRDALRLSGLDPAGIFLGKGARRRRPAARARGRAARRRRRLYGTDLDGRPAARRHLRRRHRRPGRRRHASTAPSPPGSGCATRCCRCCCSGRRPGADRRHPGLRGRPRHGWRRRVGVGQPLGGVRRRLRRPSRSPAPAPCWRSRDRRAGAPHRARGRPASSASSPLAGLGADAAVRPRAQPRRRRSRPTPCASSTSTCRRRSSPTSPSASPPSARCCGSGSGPCWWDRVAGAVGRGRRAVHRRSCLVTGSLWGRPTWGTYWDWDPRLTTTALLFLLFLGYLAVRRLPADPRRAGPAVGHRRRSSPFVDVPIVHYAVDWWRSLHQGATVGHPRPEDRRAHALHASCSASSSFGLRLRLAARAPLPPGRGSRTRPRRPASTSPSPSAAPRASR